MEQTKTKPANHIKEIEFFVGKKLNALSSNKDKSTVKKQLAEWRRSIGKNPGEVPEVWGDLLDGIPKENWDQNKFPTDIEWAVFTALGLAALHCQGSKVSIDQLKGSDLGLGQAVRKLVPKGDDDALERIMRRFNCAVTASSKEELAVHLRTLVQLLRAEGIPLNYKKLAGQLYGFQKPGFIRNVQMQWGREFYDRSIEEDLENTSQED